MIKYIFIFALSAFTFEVNAANNIFLHNLSFTHTHELKPIPSYLIAKSTFLPDRSDDLGLSSYDSLNSNYNDKNCESYPLLYCPQGAICEKCPFNSRLYRAFACAQPYILSNDECVCPPSLKLDNANDVCIKYCDNSCIEKDCIPSIDQNNCSNGSEPCDDGCGGSSRQCCITCTDKITSKPENSTYTYENCTDGDGTRQIKIGWQCDIGYHEKNSSCEKDCIINNCSGYDLAECPGDKSCESCTPTAANCSTEATKYKVVGCKIDGQIDLDTYWCGGALRCWLK